MTTARRMLLIAITCIGCVGCDQVTKALVRANVEQGVVYSYLHDTIRLTHAENPGAFLSLGERLPASFRVLLFSVVALGISAGALVLAFSLRQVTQNQIIGLALIAAGGISNWIDRVTNAGHVTDFINIGIGWLRTGIFNIADMALMSGLALCFFIGHGRSPK